MGKRKYTDFAVLYRTNAQSRMVEEIFLKSNIPYKIVGGTKFYDRKEIKDILAYLRLIGNQMMRLVSHVLLTCQSVEWCDFYRQNY